MDASIIKNGTWQDITEEFLDSVKQLNLGELLKSERFTLLEAMSAIELMDPKMDSGMLLTKSKRKIMNLEQSIKAGLVKINYLESDELIGIIDETYSCLTTWLEGYSLEQSFMTNLYLLKPERIEDRCLRVFCQTSLKIVDFMDELVQMNYCFDEEDFFINCKFQLGKQINDQKVLHSIEDLCQHYEKLLNDKQSNANQNHNNCNNKQQQEQQPSIEDQPQNEDSPSPVKFEKSHLIAIINRLRFTHNFYAAFLIIHRQLLKNHWNLNSQTDAQLMKTTKLVQNSVLTCDQHLEKCLHYLEQWKETIGLGIQPKQVNDDYSLEGDYPTIMGFEPLINLKLLPPAYPRCPSMKSRPFMVDYLKDLIIKLRYCISISSFFNQKSFNKSLDSIEHFTKYFVPKSCVISRSFLQSLYLPNRSEKLLRDELLQSLNDFCEPLVQQMRKDEVLSVALDNFLRDSSRTFLQVIGIYGHNTARQHERLPELIISFKNLQYSALLFNSAYNSGIAYSWTRLHLARLCIKYVLSGLELELFSYHEYPYVFWYLYDILYANEREQLEAAKQFIFESQILIDDQNQSKKNKNKKQRKKIQFSTNYHDNCLRNNDAYRFLTGGLFLLTYGLKRQGKIKTPMMDFTTEEKCFDHRFGTLTGTSVYKAYEQTLNRLEKLEFIYREALDCFTEAKDLFEALGTHKDCLKVCKTNMIVAKIVASNLNSVTHREVEFCFENHPSFPTVKV